MTSPVDRCVPLGRRNFLRAAVATAGIIAQSGYAFGDDSMARINVVRPHFVFDRRVSVPLNLDLDRKLSSTLTHSFTGDITSIWLDILEPLWIEGQAATAGLTRHTEFFLLRTLAI
jgi:hypothetical protein